MGKRTPALPKDKPKELDKGKNDASTVSSAKSVAKGPLRARIVTSGNSGNSASTKAVKPVIDDGRPPPLFPVGYKTPLSLLNERCQKNGWQKPDVQPFKLGPGLGHCAVVRITRIDPKNGAETITLRPSTEEGSATRLEMPTALEAKHWASVYALHRFASALQLGMVLPPQCRDYWAALQAEKKAANIKDTAFVYAEDPFAAQAARDAARQAAQDRREALQASEASGIARTGHDDDKGSKKWPEIRIGRDLRCEMQHVIRTMRKLNTPQSSNDTSPSQPFVPTSAMREALLKDLLALGYRRGHLVAALDYISVTSPSADPLLEPLLDRTAHTSDPSNALKKTVLQYLQITLSEEELPVNGHGFRGQPESILRIARRGNATPGSESARSGTGTPIGDRVEPLSLADTWLIERIAKDAGYPIKILEDVVRQFGSDEALILEISANKLIGMPIEPILLTHSTLVKKVRPAIEQRRDTEIDALQSMLGPLCRMETVRKGNRIVEICVNDLDGNSSGLSLRVLLSESSAYPTATKDNEPPVIPSFYVLSTSPELPAYIRLHLTASILRRAHDFEHTDWMAILRSGEGGLIYEMAAYLGEIAGNVLANPPAASDVMQYLRSLPNAAHDPVEQQMKHPSSVAKRRQQATSSILKADPKVLKSAFETVRASAEYCNMLVKRKTLPAWSSKAEVVNMIDNNRIVIISGATGSGKTTQCPAFVLEAAMMSSKTSSLNIICTQPRRISAIGVAQRVAQEHGQNVGEGLFGYAIRGERKASRDCRLLFCTTGILLQRLSRGGDSDLSDVSHVFVDEVHERSLDSDFLLLILREVLQRNQSIRIILMSATADSARFSRYFGNAPCIEIPGQAHAVEDFYLEDVMRATRYQAPSIKASRTYTETENTDIRNSFLGQGIEDAQLLSTLTMLTRSERIDYDLVAATAKYICTISTVEEAILIFVTGVAEISQTMRALHQALSGAATEIMPLHANLSPSEQSRIFRKTKKRKIIVATNVAETSITVDDVVYVIDTGRVKETRFDAENGLQRLVEDWNSLAGAKQRRGRAGRTKPGQCWKLYTRWQEERIPIYAQPEILRTPLAALVLQVKALRGEADIAAFLAGALDAPHATAVGEALSTLARLGALRDGDPKTAGLTPLGHNLALLPLDLRLGKMLIFASIFDCLDPILTICAALSTKSIFVSPSEQRDESKAARLRFSTGNSDLLTDLNALHAVMDLRDEPSKMRRYCDDNFISYGAVREITSLRTDYISALRSAGYSVDARPSPDAVAGRLVSDKLLKAIIYAGTGTAVRTRLPEAKYESTISGTSQIDHEAKQVRFFDDDGRVFIHPASILFGEPKLKNGFITYFNKSVTSKPFLRDATELQLSALLVFGRALRADAVKGGLSLDHGNIHLRAPPQLSVLVNELRRLLDIELAELIDEPGVSGRAASPVMQTIRNLLIADA